MAQKILVTGASGLVGVPLVKLLLAKGYQVNELTHSGAKGQPGTNVYSWDIYNNTIDEACADGVDAIIHLAGENIMAHKWTKDFKNKIVQSRVLSGRMLYNLVRSRGIKLNAFISASASGYYGNRGAEVLTEEAEPGTDFLADCCILWEETADKFMHPGTRVVKMRTGIVLSKMGGALPILRKTARFFMAAPLGSGEQYMPWAHINDVVHAYVYALEHEDMQGAYNLCAPHPVTNERFTTALTNVLHRPTLPFKVPAGLLERLRGEQSESVLASQNMSSQKLQEAGFKFKYENIYQALEQLLGKKKS